MDKQLIRSTELAMFWQTLLTAFLQLDFVPLSATRSSVFQVPPWNFILSCILPNKTSDFSMASGFLKTVSSMREEQGANATIFHSSRTYSAGLQAKEDPFCCISSETDLNCPLHKDDIAAKQFFSNMRALFYHQIDLRWSMWCWTTGNMEMLICSLKASDEKSYYVNSEYRTNLSYVLSDFSFEESSIVSQKGSVLAIPCNCSAHEICECLVPSVKLKNTYTMWVEITNGTTSLRSPLMSVKPLDIVKPNPPFNLHMEITERGELKLCWSNPKPMPYELQYEVRRLVNSSENAWQIFQIVRETSVITDKMQLGSSHSFQVRCRSLYGPGFWSDWSNLYDLNSQEVIYTPSKILTSVGSDVSIYCIYNNKNKPVSSKKIAWWLNLAERIPEHHYTPVNDHVGKVTLVSLNATRPKGKFLYDALYCCQQNDECHHRYAEIYIIDVNISISCETDGNLNKMTCRWTTNRTMLLEGSTLQLKYYRSRLYCSSMENTHQQSDSKGCQLQRDDFFECTFQPIFPLSGYTMWIEINHQLGTLESPPVCVIPMNVVKPLPPSRIKAEITVHSGLLNVSWKRPILPVYDLRFQIRYSVHGEETVWKTYDVVQVESGSVEVVDLCAAYLVQVRCSRVDGLGYWSDWSTLVCTVIKDVKAPVRGPIFWKHSQEDPVNKQKNVTLFWQPLMKNQSLCSVKGYKVVHHTSNNDSWSEYIGNETRYAFLWTESVHTVTVLAINSVGASLTNSNLTLSEETSTVNVVHSFRAYLINSSSVALSWTLLPGVRGLTAFVVEWENLNREEQIKWIQVPSNMSRFYVTDYFVAIDNYRFILYPILAEGVSKPKITNGFTKDDHQRIQNDMGLYVIVPLIMLSSVLLLGTLLISHQRMRKMLWEDVPNPKNCSWAQEVNFQKPETLEHLFIKHHEPLAFGPPHLLEPENVFEDFHIDKAFKGEDKRDLLAELTMFAKTDDSDHDSACVSSHFESDCFSESHHGDKVYQESVWQSDIKYATIVNNSQSVRLSQQEESTRSSSVDGCFAGNESLAQDSFTNCGWEVENQEFLILASLPPSQPCKISSYSTVSSEGFSESSDTDENFLEGPEKDLYYLGLTAIKQNENASYLMGNRRVANQFQTDGSYKGIQLFQDDSLDLNTFMGRSLKMGTSFNKAFISYMPQFQTNSPKRDLVKREIYNITT
ncbi:leptin receptor isoform X2 [Rhinatrema bivittatum]|uniref:leptin receptor isoform X2 n=2 Tax=Rhinatrema bivittatum TaxID=194408 RepID=UPI001129FEB8|nr:leptin receptor isoform X2 [Rhinatrema bivittatum]